jgi:short-subunit dehydrogenase
VAELLDTQVDVSVFMPGAISTGISGNSGVTMTADPSSGRILQTAPDKAARIIIAGIEANRLHIFVGKDARIMDVAIKLAPKQATNLVQRQMKGLLGQ